ncbi:MAG TPA: SRPBCC family protein [Noviherbaspirillum sp.]|uniref:SRPBCC family protein n=1 Tax=Noviherbaspirillum sp. TaxID=1926288 RepID=UPI002B48D33F|nr:SRPBCC family protein [Noviherbaspirillum sp.]HJV86123.1 SRPBCC family protein [Noviherbaspirillum sp.]
MMQDEVASPAVAGGALRELPHLPHAGSPEVPRQVRPPSWDTAYRTEDAARAEHLAKLLGWFSIGLGVAQLLAPRGVSQAAGVGERPRTMRMVGVREIASGVGILARPRQSGWIWARVAGDAIDLALLALAGRSAQAQRRRVTLATAAVAGITALDVLSGIQNQRMAVSSPESSELHVEKSLIINRAPEDCYRFWHDFENFPRFMKHVESVRISGENRMHWVAKGPAGLDIEWNAELTADEPNRYLAWRSIEGSDVENFGSVRFENAPGMRGTIVRVELHYSPPGGKAGALIAKLFGEEPSQQIDEDLRRFKWLIETGEIPTTIGQPSGTRGVVERLLRRGEAG